MSNNPQTDKGFIDCITPATKLATRELLPREWAVKDWIPLGEPSMTGGPPGAGKSLLMQTIATAVSCTDQIYGLECQQGPALYITCEDDLDELQRRQEGICTMLGIDSSQLTDLYLVSYRGQDARLARVKDGHFHKTQRLLELELMIQGAGLRLVVLDLIPDFYDGNENIRNEVNRFVKGVLGNLADKYNCAINFLYHPSRSGMADGSGLSGSTAWEGSVRSRLYLSGEDLNGVRTLERKKSNYSGTDAGFNLKWRKGCLMPTDEARKVRNTKPMGKYASSALDCLKGMGGKAPIGLWRDKWLDSHKPPPKDRSGAWRDVQRQLIARGEIDTGKGEAWVL